MGPTSSCLLDRMGNTVRLSIERGAPTTCGVPPATLAPSPAATASAGAEGDAAATGLLSTGPATARGGDETATS